MDPNPSAGQPDTRLKFIRIVGGVAAALIITVVVGTYAAPHMGRLADIVLNHTWHRDWTRLTLPADEAFSDLSTPFLAVRSYYSALYQGDATNLTALAVEPFREELRLRLQHAEAPSGADRFIYRSYLFTVMQGGGRVVVTEKFHLFWQRGLRFQLQRAAAGWSIAGVTLMKQ
jgi:hypothetical protein